MRLTTRQILICLGIGVGLTLLGAIGALIHSGDLGSLIPYLIGRAIGLTLICMVPTMIYNVVTARKHKGESAPKL
jgi:hypothetical protein